MTTRRGAEAWSPVVFLSPYPSAAHPTFEMGDDAHENAIDAVYRDWNETRDGPRRKPEVYCTECDQAVTFVSRSVDGKGAHFRFHGNDCAYHRERQGGTAGGGGAQEQDGPLYPTKLVLAGAVQGGARGAQGVRGGGDAAGGDIENHSVRTIKPICDAYLEAEMFKRSESFPLSLPESTATTYRAAFRELVWKANETIDLQDQRIWYGQMRQIIRASDGYLIVLSEDEGGHGLVLVSADCLAGQRGARLRRLLEDPQKISAAGGCLYALGERQRYEWHWLRLWRVDVKHPGCLAVARHPRLQFQPSLRPSSVERPLEALFRQQVEALPEKQSVAWASVQKKLKRIYPPPKGQQD